MNFFGKRFGKKSQPAKAAPVGPAAPVDPAQNKDMIRVFDGYGRELFISRQSWRDKVLPGTLQKAWDKPEELYNVIAGSLQDGFRAAVIEAAEHLYQIDSDRIRAACLWGIVLKDENRLDEAETVFRDFLAKHGENDSILTNLAKVYFRRNNDAKVEEILWHALEINPNQDNGMAWYEVIHRERDGKEAGLAALKRIALLPRSWRAQLWLARASLEAGQLEPAFAYYREALARAPRPVPSVMLMQMSGDLGRHGHLSELLEMTEPLFDVNLHGLGVGNNLIKAHLDLGHIDAARAIVERLYACNRPDWHKALSFWDTEITKTRIAALPVDTAQPLKVTMVTTRNPIWLPASSPACELFPAKPQDEPIVCFLGSTAKTPNPAKTIQRQMADAPGRISRALPLFLAEQTYFGSRANVQTMTPLVMGTGASFGLWETPWNDQDAAARAKEAAPPGDYIVITHILTQSDPWTLELRLVRRVDGTCLTSFNATFPSASPQEAFSKLATRLLAALCEHAGLKVTPFPPLYLVPAAAAFPFYLLRLEQLLAVRCAAMEQVNPGFLSGERDIIDGNIQLCVSCPDNPTVRLLLAQTLKVMKSVRPDILPEFANKLALLQKQKPLSEPAHTIIQGIFDEQHVEVKGR